MKTFEDTYLDYFWLWQQWQWENYAFNTQHDLNILDKEIFKLCHQIPDFGPLDRHDTLLHHILLREKVDRHPRVARLRNQLDDWDYYLDCLPYKSASKYGELQSRLAYVMQPDVMNLMRIRNQLAQNAGYNNYPDLIFTCDEIPFPLIQEIINQYLDKNLPRARSLVQKYEITWQNWFERLENLSTFTAIQPAEALLNDILHQFDLTEISTKIKISIQEGSLSGYTAIINEGERAYILTHPINNLRQKLTFYHEVGHAICHLLNEETGLFRTWTAAYDETMAVFFEYLCANVLLGPEQSALANDLLTLEYTRCALSARFEFALWSQPELADTLYKQTYESIGLEISDPGLWAIDSFRSVDPVTIHNYVIGAWLAENALQHNSISAIDWMRWLTKNIYPFGRKQSMSLILEQMHNVQTSTGF